MWGSAPPSLHTITVITLDSLSYTLLQLLEQLEGSREQCHHLESQLQKKEVAITAAQGKIELLTAEAQAKVEEL